MAAPSEERPLWVPTAGDLQKTPMAVFMRMINTKYNQSKPQDATPPQSLVRVALKDYWGLHAWSIDNIELFWHEVWTFCKIQGSRPIATITEDVRHAVLEPHQFMDDFPRWFPASQLNFAQNLLFPMVPVDPQAVAIKFRTETDELQQDVTWDELRTQVARMSGVLRRLGVKRGDRIAAYAPNCPQVLIYMLAGAALGAIFTAGSPDFGPSAIVDRFSQTTPAVLLSCNAVFYNGRIHDHLGKLQEVTQACASIKHVLVLNFIPSHGCKHHHLDWDREMERGSDIKREDSGEMSFEMLPFDHPLYILYSSGTTGRPKCIVHGAGGTLLQHMKEHVLHGSMGPGDTFLQYTTIGWMMWQWLVSALGTGATIVLYDGSPFRPGPQRLWQLAAAEHVTHFGTSAKYLQHLQELAFHPREHFVLDRLRVVFSTGSPLGADTFRFVCRAVRNDERLQLASITGGTDIVSLFAGGCPLLPVHAGEIQGPCLGMAVAAWDPDRAAAVPAGATGDLVCVRPFPCQPVAFWGDDPVTREKYRAAYFSVFPHVWHHGDFVRINPRTRGITMLGRSDGTLNPAGVRFGSADLYAICSQAAFQTRIVDALAVGVKLASWPDEQVFLFLQLPNGNTAPSDSAFDELVRLLRDTIRQQLSPRHVPARIIACPAIPHTLNGKKVEVSVKRILNGALDLSVTNLANPESIDFYRELARSLQAA